MQESDFDHENPFSERPDKRMKDPSVQPYFLYAKSIKRDLAEIALSITWDLFGEIVLARPLSINVQRGAVECSTKRDHGFVRNRDYFKSPFVQLFHICGFMGFHADCVGPE